MDASSRIYATSMSFRAVGEIIGALAALKRMSKDVFIITPGKSVRTPSCNLTIDDWSIMAGGMPVVPFEGTTTWETDAGSTCVNFTLMDGSDGLIAPAERPAGMDITKEIKVFFQNIYNDDDVFFYDIEKSIPPEDDYEGDKVSMRAGPAGGANFSDDDLLIVMGHEIQLGSIVWAERTADGDGNRYLHLVTDDGRYLRVCVGDFSR